MAKLLHISRYIHNVRSQSTSCKRGRWMSRCCEICLQTACVMYTCFITPNQCPHFMRPLPCMAICRNTTTWRVASTTSRFLPCRVSVGHNPALAPFSNVPCPCHWYFMGGEGAWDHGQTQGQLRNPDNPDHILESAAADKIRNYRDTYRRNRHVAFLPACMSTSGRIHGELLRLIFFISNKQAEDYLF
jgi:hypothetical protein